MFLLSSPSSCIHRLVAVMTEFCSEHDKEPSGYIKGGDITRLSERLLASQRLCFMELDVPLGYRIGSRDGSDGIVTGWTIGVWFPAGARDFCLLRSVQTGTGSHPASYPMGTGGKAAGAWSWPFTSAEVKNMWISYISSPHTPWCRSV
jgi:hypothetical protein